MEGTARVRNMEFMIFYLRMVDHWRDLSRGVIYTFLIEIFIETIIDSYAILRNNEER